MRRGRGRTAGQRQTRQTTWLDVWGPWILTGLVILITAWLRVRLLAVPLERDEGEFGYGGQLVLHGIAPYRHLYAMKLPGIYWAYAAVMALFGQTTVGIHIGLLVVNALTVFLVFLLASRILTPYAGASAALFYALLSISPSVFGQAAHATHFVMLFAVAGLLVLKVAQERDSLLALGASALLLGGGMLMKQSGAALIVCGAAWVLWRELRRKPISASRLAVRLVVFAALSILPLLATWAVLDHQGLLKQAIFWNFRYAKEYINEITPSDGVQVFMHMLPKVSAPVLSVWLLGGIGTVIIVLRKATPHRMEMALFAIFSLLAVVPGYYFREHYWVQFLPALAILAAVPIDVALATAGDAWYVPARVGALLVVICCVGYSLSQPRMYDYLFTRTAEENSRALYGHEPFPEAIKIAAYLQRHTTSRNSVAIIGSEPEILFLAHRVSATGHIYMYPLMEEQKYALGMQKQMIAEIERARPEYLVVVNEEDSWLHMPKSVKLLLTWSSGYFRDFRPVGIADMIPDGTVYAWDSDASGYAPKSSNFVWVLKRKD